MFQFDNIDTRILKVLQDNAYLSNAELSERIGISPSPCWRRVKRLQQKGVIRRRVTLLDPTIVGLPVSVFVRVSLERQIEAALETFENAVLSRPEVMECYLMTGDSDYLLRVVVADLAAYERFMVDYLTKINGVASINSSFALKQVKYSTALPLETLD